MKIKFSIPYKTFWGQNLQITLQGVKERIALNTKNGEVWEGEVSLPQNTETITYSYSVWRNNELEREEWFLSPHTFILPKDKEEIELKDFWFDPPKERKAGVVLPIFSLKTKNTFGVGDFGALKLLIDWANKTGQKIIQTLPLNDTTKTNSWKDSYPYNAISIYALHPMYIDLEQLSFEKDEVYKQDKERLNALPKVDYEEVNKLKLIYMRKAFYSGDATNVLLSQEFNDFFTKNMPWLIDYSAFCFLRDTYNTTDFSKWESFSKYDKKKVYQLYNPKNPNFKKISFYLYVQFKLHQQLKEVHNYAKQKNVMLKGDIPIGICPQSVEAWVEPELFNLKVSAGAPPDPFSDVGQNWGFPTYNWNEMAKDNYSWWKNRFKNMEQYFDAYRIDHILGFFRIWEIPLTSVNAILGHFNPSLPLSKEEIENFGFTFDEKYLKPLITDEFLEELFDTDIKLVKQKYLHQENDGTYTFYEEFNTQQKLLFAESNTERRKKLFKLVSNVLFIRDEKNNNLYHPRISTLTDLYFRTLSINQKATFTDLYNDYFYKRHNDFWKKEALKKLSVITKSAKMLPCAEDLGMIPDCVPDVMKKLQLLSLEIQTMPKQLGLTFAQTERYPFLSVATFSTHDMPTMRMWWKENKVNAQRFYEQVLGHNDEIPEDLPANIAKEIIKKNLESPSMLCIFSFQDWCAINEDIRRANPDEERINIPSINPYYWNYRMHLNIEELLDKNSFNKTIHNLIKSAKRD